ncbi:hypothetical protein NVP2275O_211 [Vibrio phage 2.275.O._10N.286.54.E11]|nr:hypothetical protein NVP2275O_211 [Vibrio phage 2.275.O._10N.286.54.E11]
MSSEVKVRFTVHPLFEMYEEDYNIRQVSVKIDSDRIAVINCQKTKDKWGEPKFVILKGQLTYREMTGLGFAMQRAQKIMMSIGQLVVSTADLELLIEKADGETHGPCHALSNDE